MKEIEHELIVIKASVVGIWRSIIFCLCIFKKFSIMRGQKVDLVAVHTRKDTFSGNSKALSCSTTITTNPQAGASPYLDLHSQLPDLQAQLLLHIQSQAFL